MPPVELFDAVIGTVRHCSGQRPVLRVAFVCSGAWLPCRRLKLKAPKETLDGYQSGLPSMPGQASGLSQRAEDLRRVSACLREASDLITAVRTAELGLEAVREYVNDADRMIHHAMADLVAAEAMDRAQGGVVIRDTTDYRLSGVDRGYDRRR